MSRVEVVVIEGCRHAPEAMALAASVLSELGLSADISQVTVTTDHEATARGFVGSPSFFVDGTDLFPVPGVVAAMACRVYHVEDGRLSGLPDRAVLMVRLAEALAS